jgi:signal transduction histidine kinase
MRLIKESGMEFAWMPQVAAVGASVCVGFGRRLIGFAARAGRWWLDVRTDDPVRQTRLRGLLLVVPPMLLGGVWLTWRLQSLPSVITMLAIALCAIPARRGSSLGALVMTLLVAAGIGIGFDPATYVGPPIVVHALFLFPIALAALTLPPPASVLAAAATIAALALRAWTAGSPASDVLAFSTVGMVDLIELALPLMGLSALFGRALRAKEQALRGQAAANAELVRLNTEQEQRVRAATDDLRRTQAIQQAEWGSVAHDINNAMAAAQAVVDDVLLDMAMLNVPDEKRALVERRVVASFRVIGNLVDDMNTVTLLDHARLSLEFRPVDVAAIARSVVEQLDAQAQQYGCRLSFATHGSLPLIAADAWRVERALANLIGNGVKYTRRSRSRDRRVDVVVNACGGGVAVTIADTGLGMDAAALELVGLPFTRLASARGTTGMGIGVYLSRGIIEQHGGTLTYTSAGTERGTTVTVWLPEHRAGEGAVACTDTH